MVCKKGLVAWLERAEKLGHWETPREGKRVATFSVEEEKTVNGKTFRFRRVIERTIDKHGQILLIPDIKIEGWWASLDSAKHDDESIVALYCGHVTPPNNSTATNPPGADLDAQRAPEGSVPRKALINSKLIWRSSSACRPANSLRTL